MEEEKKKLEKLYQELNEEDTVTKKWNQALIPKAILLFPPIAFALTFLFTSLSSIVKKLFTKYVY